MAVLPPSTACREFGGVTIRGEGPSCCQLSMGQGADGQWPGKWGQAGPCIPKAALLWVTPLVCLAAPQLPGASAAAGPKRKGSSMLQLALQMWTAALSVKKVKQFSSLRQLIKPHVLLQRWKAVGGVQLSWCPLGRERHTYHHTPQTCSSKVRRDHRVRNLDHLAFACANPPLLK